MALQRWDGSRLRGFGALVRDLAEGFAGLARGEARLATLELHAATKGIAKGATLMATAAALAVLGALSLLTGLMLLAGDQWLPADRYWLAALIVVVVTGAIAAWFVRRGLALVSASRLAPDETVATLKEDKEWLKQRLTSGGTSS
jgi:uncharacterized membrane protein YqjE